MDYCYTCRRILNGALVCPGCGACAPESAVRSAATQTRSASAPGADGRPFREAVGSDLPGPGGLGDSFPPGEHRGDGYGSHGADASADGSGGLPGDERSALGPASIAPTLHRGRAARRRQQARWRKTQRRAGVATAVALFGGGVAVASWQNGSGRSTSASSYDSVTPVSLHDGGDGTGAGSGATAAPAAGAQHTAPHSRSAHSAPAATPHSGRPTQAGTDGGVTAPLPGSAGSTVPAAGGSAGTARHATGTGTTQAATGTGSGTASTDPGSAPAGSTGASSGSGTQTTAGGSGSTGDGSTATTAPTTPTTTTPPPSTSPTTPPSQQGLCVLVLCIR